MSRGGRFSFLFGGKPEIPAAPPTRHPAPAPSLPDNSSDLAPAGTQTSNSSALFEHLSQPLKPFGMRKPKAEAAPALTPAERLPAPQATPAPAPQPVLAQPTPPETTVPASAPKAKVPRMGHVEILSTEFALGWAASPARGQFPQLYAVLGTEIIGAATAHFGRADLDSARAAGTLNAYAFLIIFTRTVATEDVGRIQIMPALGTAPLPPAGALKHDRTPPLRVFVLGSPRSGTSEMGTTLAAALKLPWLGEGHAAPLFATAANALQGDDASTNGFVRFLARERYRKVAIDAAREAYFFVHGSASFLDKTPGVPMIGAVPFLHECFPDARFIFLWRHPVGNVLSRMAKFGGNIDSHCRDWAAAMNTWRDVRKTLPHYLEIRQEDMMDRPHAVAAEIARYVGAPDAATTIGASLTSGTRERTGAGLGKTTTAESGWTPEQVAAYSRLCSPVLSAFEAERTAAAAEIAV